LRETARFAIPAGTAAGVGVVASYFFALNVADLPLRESLAGSAIAIFGLAATDDRFVPGRSH
jgi:hypothetical protein